MSQDEPQDKEYMATLAKGLAVLRAFGERRQPLTVSEAAAACGLSRATARRILRTLNELGYVEQAERSFALAPRILELGFGYLSTQDWIDRAVPLMKEASETTGESCSAAILQGAEVVYVARVPTRRIMSGVVSIGSRLPAFHTSIGRAQLGFLGEEEVWRRLRAIRMEPYTPGTITDLKALHERIMADRRQGFSIVDEELERGLRSIAVPIVNRAGQAVAAVNLSTTSTRTTRNEMRAKFFPELKRISDEVSLFLG